MQKIVKTVKFNQQLLKKIFNKTAGLIILMISLLIGRFFIIQILEHTSNDIQSLSVSFFDVGQGDAVFIKTPQGRIVLIDGGPDNIVLWRLGEKMPFYKRQIEAIVISHFHDDHVLGLIEVLRRYRVKYLIFGPELEKTALAELIFSEAAKRQTKIIQISSIGNIALGLSCEIFFFNPLSLAVKNNDNNSLLAKLNCADVKVLFSGDNEEEVERALISTGLDLKADIFKASHHGSKTSNKIAFLQAVNPEIIVISAGENNRFNHPSLETLKTISDLNKKLFRTDQQGTVDFKLILNIY